MAGELQFNRIPAIIAALPEIASQLVRKGAFDVEAAAKAKVRVDTGAAKNSIYTVMQGHDGSGEAMSAAQAKNPKAQLVEPVSAPASALEAFVCVGVAHGVFLELGTRNMPADRKSTRLNSSHSQIS